MWFLACSVRAMTVEKVKSQLLKNAISSPGKIVNKKKQCHFFRRVLEITTATQDLKVAEVVLITSTFNSLVCPYRNSDRFAGRP